MPCAHTRRLLSEALDVLAVLVEAYEQNFADDATAELARRRLDELDGELLADLRAALSSRVPAKVRERPGRAQRKVPSAALRR